MEYQKCPVCSGNGLVSGGFHGSPYDVPYWAATGVTEVCRTCKGKGIIIKPDSYKVSETTG